MPKKPKYKSGLEETVHKHQPAWEYEPFTVAYKMEREYTPDFVPKNNKKIWIETKGRFRDYTELQKYLGIKKSHPDIRLVFIFENSKKRAYPQCKRRKDGSYLTLGEWADKNGFEYHDLGAFVSGKTKIKST